MLRSFGLILQIFTVILPWRIRRIILILFYNANIDKSARIGYSIIHVEAIDIGEHVKIGHFNLIKGLTHLRLSEYVSIGNFNWISALSLKNAKRFQKTSRFPSLAMGKHSAITQHHRLDCSGKISIGEYSIVAGYGTQILTHSIDLEKSVQSVLEIDIGAYTFIGTRSILLPGSNLPRYSVLGAGSVLVKAYTEEYFLYSGVPAKPIRPISKNYNYFHRINGYVE